jgi:hypothetical protein
MDRQNYSDSNCNNSLQNHYTAVLGDMAQHNVAQMYQYFHRTCRLFFQGIVPNHMEFTLVLYSDHHIQISARRQNVMTGADCGS